MTQSIAVNSSNDIFVGPDGNLAMVSGLTAAIQNCKSAMQAQLGEMVLNLTRGVPSLSTIWLNFQPVQFEAAARAILLTVPDVVEVKSFVIERDGENADYTATIRTIYSAQAVTIAGGLTQP